MAKGGKGSFKMHRHQTGARAPGKSSAPSTGQGGKGMPSSVGGKK